MDENLDRQLLALEERLLRHEVRHSRPALEELLADGFVEHGASGRVYDRAQIIAALLAETDRPGVAIRDFRARSLSAEIALATYRVVRVEADEEISTSVRASVWIRRGDRWQIAFHQGTPLPPA